MILLIKKRTCLILFLYFLIILIKRKTYLFTSLNNDEGISIVINLKNLTKEIHHFYFDFIRNMNTTRNFYFIKSETSFTNNIDEFVERNTVKIVQSNFPDSIFLPLIVSLYGNTVPDYILYIEGEDLLNTNKSQLVKWVKNSINKLKKENYDYIFGNSQLINGEKIGCSLLVSKSSILQHLLYHTDSDTTHLNPFIQLSLATKTNFSFIQLNGYIKVSNLENIVGKFSQNMDCPSINDKLIPNIGIMIPAFKRNYFSDSFPAFSNQTFKPKFYVIIQNDNKMYLNISLIQNMVNEPIYHIWMRNWNSYFYLSLRISSVLPCDFILKYDDDQWPNDTNLNQNLINNIKNKNIILGLRSFVSEKPICGYSPKKYKKIDEDIKDHVAVPELIRQGYLKLDARNKIFRIFGFEDVALSVNSYLLCNVSSKTINMNLIEKQSDGNSRNNESQIISEIKNENIYHYDFFMSSYCFFIHAGYIPIKWDSFRIPKKDYINITIEHKSLI